MIRPLTLLICLGAALPAQAQSPDELGMGGLALRECREFTGPENLPLLAQSVDWILGYFAGRIDRGDRRDPASVLSTTDQVDLVTAIVGYCSNNPDALLIEMARDHARAVFGTLPAPVIEEAAPEEAPRPELRPEDEEEGTEPAE